MTDYPPYFWLVFGVNCGLVLFNLGLCIANGRLLRQITRNNGVAVALVNQLKERSQQ